MLIWIDVNEWQIYIRMCMSETVFIILKML